MRKSIAKIFMILTLTLCGCASIPDPVTTQEIPLLDIRQFENHASLPVTLKSAPVSKMYITAPSSLQKTITFSVKNKILSLHSSSRVPQNKLDQIQVVVCLPNTLTVLKQAGNGTILGSDVQFDHLEIISEGSGAIELKDSKVGSLNIVQKSSSPVALAGDFNIENILQNGTGPINVYWIHSSKLNIQSYNTGIITLAGTADRVDASLGNRAFLDAKYLRIRQSHINAQGNAVAHIHTMESQNLRAGNNASIYFYKDPKHKAHYASAHGSIMRTTGLGHWALHRSTDYGQ